MKETKTKLYVIPGLGESTRSKNYSNIIQYARSMGLDVIPVNIVWSTKMDMSDYIDQVNKKIPDDIKSDYILGFSFGSYIAINLAKEKNAKGYILCSTSPYFRENLKDIPAESKKYFGKKLFESFKKYSTPKGIKNRAWFFIGGSDWEIAVDLTEKLYKNWLGRKSIKIIDRVGHELSHPDYLKNVKSTLKMLQT